MTKQKLGNPAFIIAVLLLVLNDWYLKQTYHNWFTGKISDFAGLFALPFLLSALFPRKTISIYIVMAVVFVIWKSPLAQPFIDALNSYGLPTQRTVDFSDYISLFILPVSYYSIKLSPVYNLRPAFLNVVVALSILSFIATTRPKGRDVRFYNINKTYVFNFSKRELVSRLNALQMEYVKDINKYLSGRYYLNNGKLNTQKVLFDEHSGFYFYKDDYVTGKIDTVAQIINIDKVKDTDTIFIKTELTRINISGTDNASKLKLIGLTYYVANSEKGDHQQKAVNSFERFIIKRIKSK